MEIILDLMERKLLIDGVEQECICKGEEWFGEPMPSLGKHSGCGNMVKVILMAIGFEEDFGVPIKKVKIYPERGIEIWEKKELKVDNTKLEFWSDDLVQEVYWRATKNAGPMFQNFKNKFDGNLQELWNANGGKACRGLDLKYIQNNHKAPMKVTPEQQKMAEDFVANLTWEEINETWKKKQEETPSTRTILREEKAPRTPYLDAISSKTSQ